VVPSLVSGGVELIGRLSNPETRTVINQVNHLITRPDAGLVKNESVEAPARQRWRIVDRLGDGALSEIRRSFATGTPKSVLAKRYEVSLTTVKRLLRRNE
jgi:hypothetical protein